MKHRFVRLIAIILMLSLSLSLMTGCGNSRRHDDDDEEDIEVSTQEAKETKSKKVTEETEETQDASGKPLIGISMPTDSVRRWAQDGEYMKRELEAAEYEVDLQFANNEVVDQYTQIFEMIDNGCEVLIIAPVDGSALGNVLKNAKEKNITVIAFDRLIMKTDAVDYYATFDNYMVGQMQGQYIEQALGLKNAGNIVYNMEMFAGPSDYNVSRLFFQGAYDVLKPYIDAGTLNIFSGLTEFEDIAVPGFITENAQSMMEERLSTFYADGTKLDVVLSPNDSIAQGISNALTDAGKQPGLDFPIVTGQDCDIPNVKNIIAGKQSMSVFKDTRDLSDMVVRMVIDISEGKRITANDTATFDNGVKVVPTFFCVLKYADKDNYKELLINSGYYSEADLQ